jgi:hypothetical protein
MIPFIPPDYNLQPYGIVQQFYLTKFEDGSGSGRIYVKTEALRQQYLSDPD